VAEALLELTPVDLRFIGGRRGLEGDLAGAAGIRFHAVPLPSLRDPDSKLALITHVLLVPIATIDALAQLIRWRPNVVVTSGSFSSVPVLFAARVLQVPIYLWVGDAIPGRALRAVARWSSGIGLTFEPALRALPGGKARVTGNPVRRSLLRWTKADGRRALGLAADGPVVLITGGSQGSEKINNATFGALSPGSCITPGPRACPGPKPNGRCCPRPSALAICRTAISARRWVRPWRRRTSSWVGPAHRPSPSRSRSASLSCSFRSGPR